VSQAIAQRGLIAGHVPARRAATQVAADRAAAIALELAVEIRGQLHAYVVTGHERSPIGPSSSRMRARALWSCDLHVPTRHSRIVAHSSCESPSTSWSTR